MHHHCTPIQHCIPMGPISGLSGLVRELMLHLGYAPEDYPDVAHELEQALGDETLDLGREILAEHGLSVRE